MPQDTRPISRPQTHFGTPKLRPQTHSGTPRPIRGPPARGGAEAPDRPRVGAGGVWGFPRTGGSWSVPGVSLGVPGGPRRTLGRFPGSKQGVQGVPDGLSVGLEGPGGPRQALAVVCPWGSRRVPEGDLGGSRGSQVSRGPQQGIWEVPGGPKRTLGVSQCVLAVLPGGLGGPWEGHSGVFPGVLEGHSGGPAGTRGDAEVPQRILEVFPGVPLCVPGVPGGPRRALGGFPAVSTSRRVPEGH